MGHKFMSPTHSKANKLKHQSLEQRKGLVEGQARRMWLMLKKKKQKQKLNS